MYMCVYIYNYMHVYIHMYMHICNIDVPVAHVYTYAWTILTCKI